MRDFYIAGPVDAGLHYSVPPLDRVNLPEMLGLVRSRRSRPAWSHRVDLLVIWPDGEGRESRFVVECKLVMEGRSRASTVEAGRERTAAYMDISGADAGHLVVFDMRGKRTRAEKVSRENRSLDAARIAAWGA